ncbi:helix-turn-helix domain-containing protein [Fictibacillus enclensis]|uniref:helix-turn-helix domain-containing protein n=1 Tax=Fictibacillus enclensis TaxID=1017270 RepID=UPI0025A0981B|nr:helix-turn-helix domain-containing protein [Fictibacillus enclensis]MDM5340347.1 helix-turn-helix domain-containing protein [Fictibacillus enclensis]
MRKWLLQLRQQKNMSQGKVASAAFIDRSYYSQIEWGKRVPSQEVARRIAEVLNFDMARFYSNYFNEPFNEVLSSSPVSIAHCDLQLRYTWAFNPPSDYDAPNFLLGKRDDELIDHAGSKEFMALKYKIIKTDQPQRKLIHYDMSDGIHLYDIFGKPIYSMEGKLTGASFVCTDLTAIKQQLLQNRSD